ncbi:MAG: hypothetical protein WDM84_00295 [Bauldia sp.]
MSPAARSALPLVITIAAGAATSRGGGASTIVISGCTMASWPSARTLTAVSMASGRGRVTRRRMPLSL